MEQRNDERPRSEFEESAEPGRMGLVAEFWLFLSDNKKWWILPILVALVVLGLLAVFGSSGGAPFVYTLF